MRCTLRVRCETHKIETRYQYVVATIGSGGGNMWHVMCSHPRSRQHNVSANDNGQILNLLHLQNKDRYLILTPCCSLCWSMCLLCCFARREPYLYTAALQLYEARLDGRLELPSLGYCIRIPHIYYVFSRQSPHSSVHVWKNRRSGTCYFYKLLRHGPHIFAALLPTSSSR